jgi:hypothetical protein
MNYVVAAKWPGGAMNIYTYGQDIQEGTLESAKAFLEYVEHMEPDDVWNIYEVEFKLVS